MIGPKTYDQNSITTTLEHNTKEIEVRTFASLKQYPDNHAEETKAVADSVNGKPAYRTLEIIRCRSVSPGIGSPSMLIVPNKPSGHIAADANNAMLAKVDLVIE